MKNLILLFSALIGFASSLAQAQPVIWKQSTPNTSFPGAIRDSSGFLYFVTRTATFRGRQLNITKYNAAGVAQWTRTIGQTGTLDIQYNIRDVALSPTHLYVVFQERNTGGFGSLQSSRVMNFGKADGSTTVDLTSSAHEFEAVAGGTAYATVLRKDTTTNVAEVMFIQQAGWSISSVANLGVVTRIKDIVMDASDNAYAVTGDGGDAQLTKCSNAAGVVYQTAFTTGNYANEVAETIAIDPVANRAYLLGYGTWHLAPFDFDAVLWVANLSTGAQINITAALGSALDDENGALLVVPGNGVIVSGRTPSNSTTSFRRYSTGGSFVWEREVADSPGGYGRAQAYDADGNVLGLTPTSGETIRLSRINVANGDLLSTLTFPCGTGDVPLEIFTDAAGAAYVNYFDDAGAHLARVQRADMSLSSNLMTGGYPVTLQITAAAAAATDETWTLSSSNASVATVPASTTITAGNSTATASVTTLPVAANTNVSINARYGGMILQRTLTVLAPQLVSIGASPNSLIGGNNFSLALTLTGQAPTGGRTITLSSSKPAVVALPATYTIPAGIGGVGISTATFAVNTNQGVVLTATLGTVTKTVFMAVNAPSLTNLTVSPATVQGGTNSGLVLSINGIAPTGGFAITLISGAPGIVLLPGTASVAAGLTTRSLNFATTAVTSTVNVTLFATRAGIYRTATLTVTP